MQGLVSHRDREKLNQTYREVQRLCTGQHIPGFLFHDLRHCAVTNLADSGIDTETIMKIVGHSSMECFCATDSEGGKARCAIASLDATINTQEHFALPAPL